MIKRPRHIREPSSKKKARSKEKPESTEREKVVWRIGILDRHGEWGWDDVENSTLWDNILEKMKNFETMTWADVRQGVHNHFIPISEICRNAHRRLEDNGLDDIDELFQLGLSGKERIFGIRDGRTFKILWWDPNHTVCPVQKKHT